MQIIYCYALPMLTSADSAPHAGVLHVPVQPNLASDDALSFAPSHHIQQRRLSCTLTFRLTQEHVQYDSN